MIEWNLLRLKFRRVLYTWLYRARQIIFSVWARVSQVKEDQHSRVYFRFSRNFGEILLFQFKWNTCNIAALSERTVARTVKFRVNVNVK
jgi:hypothetical protein